MNAAELASGGTGARTIGLIPRGGIVTNASVTVITPIAGATDIAVTVGFTGTAAGFIASTDLDALTATAYNTGASLDTEPGYVNNTTAAVAIIATISGAVSSITAGEVIFGLTILDPFGLV